MKCKYKIYKKIMQKKSTKINIWFIKDIIIKPLFDILLNKKITKEKTMTKKELIVMTKILNFNENDKTTSICFNNVEQYISQ